MARLIPSFMDDRTPPGERDVFNLFASGSDDWVVLHSLDLAPWNRNLRTEIDFVVIVPDTGILCIEVKSHDHISFDGDRWHPDTIKRSPFKQASDGRHTFYRRFSDIAPQFKQIPIVHCCIFPRATFDLSPNLSVPQWELMDLRSFGSFNSGNDFCANLRMRMEKSIAADARITPLRNSLSPTHVEAIIKLCVPVHKFTPDSRDEIRRREEAVEKILREQQKPILKLAVLNDRLIVSGGAGTGKTLIAMEVAQRAAEKGQRVALLCYNQLVGDWIKQKIEQVNPRLPNLVAGRAIRVMAELTGVEIPNNPSRYYWEEQLPQELEERLTDPDFKAVAAFDYLVLDEAQDILAKPRLWQCLTQFLTGGANHGAFALFGDFDHQVLGEREAMWASLVALDEYNRPSHWNLDENCRNYPIVGSTAVKLAGFTDPVYSGYLRTGGGLHNYDIFFYDNEQAQLDKLSRWITEFRAQGYKPSEITLLSLRADHLSAASRLDPELKVRPARQSGTNTAYASVHAYKGLENKVVILTDVVLGNKDYQRDLFYTGMTRATESVRILSDKGSQDVINRWLTGNN